MNQKEYYKKLKEFLIGFYEVTNLFISLDQFLLFIEMLTQKKKPDLYYVDYTNLYNFILDRTDVPLTKNK